jgi:eukaryotic-like serine/threonine-protein kinase
LGELVQARQQLERARELRRARGLGAFVAETELALASLCLEEGRPEEALGGAESALAAYAALKNPDREGLACTVKARALLALGELAGAGEAMERARTLASRSEYVLIAAEVQLTGALWGRWEGGPSVRETVRQLQALARRAAREGLKRVELEARLLRVELDQELDEAVVAKELRSLRREANQLGYRGLLKRVSALKVPGGSSRA